MIFKNKCRVPSGGRKAATRTSTFLAVALAALGGCDFLDPTNVENPQTTTEDLARAQEPTRALLPGLRAQMARAIGSNAVINEVVSDNYSIHGTGLNSAMDDPRAASPSLLNATGSTTGSYWNLQELRALSTFILEDIVPQDATATAAQRAEARYYRGMAFLMLGENFSHFPLERDGAVVEARQSLERALSDFEAALGEQGSGEFATRSRAALARAHRALGNEQPARQFANQALADGSDFAFLQGFDNQSINNGPHVFTVVRALKEMQPLPRLDFLDPKYLTRDAGIPVAKAEEMHLILAEADLAQNNLASARSHIADAVELALSRPVEGFVDGDERLNADLTPRPRDSSILIRADGESPFRAGLVLDRPNQEVPIPVISGTSLDADSVRALTGEEETWHAFHLARQEILFLEGRRMSDLGIRLPMMLREVDANPNISDGSPGTVAVVPGYIPASDLMDLFDPASPYDDEGNLLQNEVTMRVDVNRILAREQVNAFR